MRNCPCGHLKPYEECCKIIHIDIKKAITAEDLMRSRYAAFALGNGDYLFNSHDAKTRITADKKAIENWAKSVQWMSLEIINSTLGTESDATGTVEFKAFFIEAGKLDTIHENSKFRKENDHWVYVDRV